MNDSALRQLFSGRHGLVLVSTGEYAPAPPIDSIKAGQTDSYPQGWEPLSATSTENLIEIALSEGEDDWKKFDDLDSLCVLRQYVTLKISQLSMSQAVFERTFGAGEWDAALGAYRAEGRVSPAYRSVLICFFGSEKVMGVYFSRVKLTPGDALATLSRSYFDEIPLTGYVQEPTQPGGKYVIYEPRERGRKGKA